MVCLFGFFFVKLYTRVYNFYFFKFQGFFCRRTLHMVGVFVNKYIMAQCPGNMVPSLVKLD